MRNWWAWPEDLFLRFRANPVIALIPYRVILFFINEDLDKFPMKKNRIKTNVEIIPHSRNGLSKKSVADCLQTRPIDHRFRLVGIRGELTSEEMKQIDEALKVVFAL